MTTRVLKETVQASSTAVMVASIGIGSALPF